MKQFFVRTLLLSFTLQFSTGHATETAAEKAAKIDTLLVQYSECCSFSGAVLVSEHDKVIFKKGYGLANREWNIKNTTDVKFRIGSLTKQFTSMLVMQQVAKGRIKLDGHISDYLPYYRQDTGQKVTIHELLNHTSGIPSYTSNPKFEADVSRNYYTVDDFVKQFCSGELEFEPGTKFVYDNSGYFILGAILEHITGKKFETLLKDDILIPLDMKDTGIDSYAEILLKRAAGYQETVDGIVNAPYVEMALPFAAGAMYSTVEDFYKWDQALYTDKLIPSEFKQKMFTPGLGNYGYGWKIFTTPEGEPGAGHEGGINGFNTLIQRFVQDHNLITIFNNTPGAHLIDIAIGIRSILYGQEVDVPTRTLNYKKSKVETE